MCLFIYYLYKSEVCTNHLEVTLSDNGLISLPNFRLAWRTRINLTPVFVCFIPNICVIQYLGFEHRRFGGLNAGTPLAL